MKREGRMSRRTNRSGWCGGSGEGAVWREDTREEVKDRGGRRSEWSRNS